MLDAEEETVTRLLKTNTFNDTSVASSLKSWASINECTNFIVSVDTTSVQAIRGIWPTADVQFSLTQALERSEAHLRQMYEADISLLNDVIEWQAQTIDYNALQQALQFGAIEEADFHAEAERFIRNEQDFKETEVINSIRRLQSILRNPLSSEDYANLLSIDLDDLNKCKALVDVDRGRLGS